MLANHRNTLILLGTGINSITTNFTFIRSLLPNKGLRRKYTITGKNRNIVLTISVLSLNGNLVKPAFYPTFILFTIYTLENNLCRNRYVTV